MIKSKKSSETFLGFLLDMLSIFLLSTGFSLLINSIFTIALQSYEIILRALIITVLLAFITRSRYIFLGSIGALLLALFGYLFFSDNLAAFPENVKGFFSWWGNNLSKSSPYNTDLSKAILFWIIVLFVTSLTFLLVRGITSTLPILIIGVCSIPLLLILGNGADTVLSVSAVLLGILPLFARDNFFGKQSFKRKEKYTAKTSRNKLSLIALSVCVLLTVGVCFVLPSDTSDWRTRTLSDSVFDIQKKYNLYSKAQKSFTNATLSDLSLQERTDRIGGKIGNNSKEVLAEITADNHQLFKVTTFDNFTGWQWQNTLKRDFIRYDKEDSVNKRNLTFSGAGFDSETFNSMLDKYLPYESITVKFKKDSPSLLTTAQMNEFKELTESNNPLIFDSRGGIYSFFNEKAGYTYSFSTHRFPSIDGEKNRDLSFINFIAMTKLSSDKQYDDDKFYNLYTKTPKYWSKEYEKLAKTLSDLSGGGEFYTAENICRFFSTNNGYSYTKNPKKHKDSITAVDALLLDKKGTCVQYSTAMAMMTRSVGIPSRLCIGYKSHKPKGYDTYVVRACDSYTWVECYFKGIGWIPFDPYPRDYDESYIPPQAQEPQQTEQQNKDNTPEKEIQHDFNTGLAEHHLEEDKPATPPEESNPVLPFIILAIVLVIILILLIIRTVFAEKSYDPNRVINKTRSLSGAAEYYYKDILRILKGFHIKRKKYKTIRELFLSLPDEIKSEDLLKTLEIIEAIHYGSIAPDQYGVTIVANTRNALNVKLKEHKKPFVFFIKRRVFLPVNKFGIYKYD